jgi:exodeoxyribonuclease V beta subunit
MGEREYISFDPIQAPLAGSHVVEASAGTGKTYNLTFLFLRLVLEQQLPVERILVVTFTNLATAELRDEVRLRLRRALQILDGGVAADEQLTGYLAGHDQEESARARQLVRRALANFDQAAIFSIHGFCQRMLHHSAFESGVAFDLTLQADQLPLHRELASDFWAVATYAAPEPFVDYLGSVAKLDRDRLVSLVALAADKPDVKFLYGDCNDEEVEPGLFAAFAAARTAWREGRESARDLLQPLGSDQILKKPYQDAALDQLLEAVDAFLAPSHLRSLAAPTSLALLSPAGLADGIYAGKRKRHDPPEHPVFDAVGALCDQLARADAVYANRARGLKRGLVRFVRSELARRKRERRVQTFNDQLYDLDRALTDPSGSLRLAAEIRRRFDAALIDEFQDTNPVQYRIFGRLFHDGETPFFMIGDPKQSIYAFRGGDIFAYLTAVREAGSAPYTLDVNWRADHRLIRGVSTLFERVERPFLSAEIGFPRVEPRPAARDRDVLEIDGEFPPPLQFLLDADDGEEPNGAPASADDEYARVAADIARLLDSEAFIVGRRASDDGGRRDRDAERITAGDVAVLLTANFQAPLLQAALRERGVPSVLETDKSVFGTHEADELMRLVEAVAEPSNPGKLRAALCTDLIGLSANEIWSLQDDDRAWEEWVVRLRGWQQVWTRRGLIQLLRSVSSLRPASDRPPVQARILGLTDGERRMTNLLHLGELLHRQASDGHLGTAGLLRWFELQRAGGGDGESAELRLESDERAVKLLTVFKAKGLQYPVVYLPFFRRGKLFAAGLSAIPFHDPSRGDEPRVDLGSDELEAHREIAAREELAERLRVLYVALTRAQHLCRVVWGHVEHKENSALGFLLHRPVAATDVEQAKEYVRELGPDRLVDDLSALADRSEGGIGFYRLGDGSYSRSGARAGDRSIAFESRILSREIPAPWTASSYSGLVRSAVGSGSESRREPLPAGSGEPVPLAGFPAGADPGLFFHEVFEKLDFTDDDPQVLRRLVDRLMPRYNLSRKRWAEPACDGVTAALDTVLDPRTDLRLRGVPTGRRLDEIPFVLPVAGGASAAAQPLTPARLAAAFAEHGGEALAGYAEQLERLEFAALRGYLRGAADLVFEHAGKWHVLDYKSNHLGDRYGDYTREHLLRAMGEHHYFLQYHLYTLAVQRFLRHRLGESYRFGERFGGVYYLFLRGMSPVHGDRFGVFFDAPRVELIDSLDRLIAGSPGGAP